MANDVEKWFQTSNYDESDERPLPIGKNKRVIGLFKDEFGGKIMTEFAALRAKAYAYSMDYGSEHKKAIKLQYIHTEQIPLKCEKVGDYLFR